MTPFFNGRPCLTVRTDLVTDSPLTQENVELALSQEKIAAIDLETGIGEENATEFLGFAKSWPEVQELVRNHFEGTFMRGDCWHLALAINARLGLPLGGIGRVEGDAWIIDHVYAELGDNLYFDVRGLHHDFASLISYRLPKDRDGYEHRPVTPADIVRTLDGFAQDEGYEPELWRDPTSYEYASLSLQLVDVLEIEAIARKHDVASQGYWGVFK